jgi:hypothetical protein
MKKFLSNILIFSILFFAFDKFFIVVRNYAPQLEVDQRLEVLLKGKMDADLLIFGSSVGARGIIASTLSKELNIKAYNLSYPGSNIDFHEYLLRQVLAHDNKKPGTVLLTLDEPSELVQNSSINFRLERLYPLIKYFEIRDELVEREQKNKMLAQLFVLYQFNKSNFDLRQKQFTVNDSILPCGSMPSYTATTNFPAKYEQLPSYYDKENESIYLRNKFNSFVELCHKNQINLVLVFPPKFKNRNQAFEERFKELTENKALYYSYDDQNLAYRNKLFYGDASHLRTNGALLFSQELANFLRAQNKINQQ